MIKTVPDKLHVHVRAPRGPREFVNVSEWRVTDQGNLIIELVTDKPNWQFVYARGAWSELESVWE